MRSKTKKKVTCTAGVTDGFCQTNLTSGVGSCVCSTCNTDPNSLYCNSNNNCNQIVTQCYNPANRTFVTCDQTGLNTYCQVNEFFTIKIYYSILFNSNSLYKVDCNWTNFKSRTDQSCNWIVSIDVHSLKYERC